MSKRYSLTSITVGAFAFMLLGCQSAESPALEQRPEASARHAAHVSATPSAQFIQHGERRVHVLLARRVELPFEVESDRVRLGAGDGLGEQMFERYASFVRSQQRRDEREFVHQPEPADEPGGRVTDSVGGDGWVERTARVLASPY